MTFMLRPLRGMRCSQDLDVGVLGESGGGVRVLCLTTANSYQIYPRTPPELSQIDEHRDASHPRSALSQVVLLSLVSSRTAYVATALAVFDRRKYTTGPSQTTRVLCRAVVKAAARYRLHNSQTSPDGLTSSSPPLNPHPIHCVILPTPRQARLSHLLGDAKPLPTKRLLQGHHQCRSCTKRSVTRIGTAG